VPDTSRKKLAALSALCAVPDTSREKLAALSALCAVPDTSRDRLALIKQAIAAPPSTLAGRDMVRTSEACRILGGAAHPITPATLLRWVRKGLVHRYGASRWARYDVAELNAVASARPD